MRIAPTVCGPCLGLLLTLPSRQQPRGRCVATSNAIAPPATLWTSRPLLVNLTFSSFAASLDAHGLRCDASTRLLRLGGVRFRDLPDKDRKIHIESGVDLVRTRVRITAHHFHGDGEVVRQDHAALHHTRDARLALSQAERS